MILETHIKELEFHCPKCDTPQEIEMEFEGSVVNQFDFECICQCGCVFKYQYENVSYKNEMSSYKNEYTYDILSEVEKIMIDTIFQ